MPFQQYICQLSHQQAIESDFAVTVKWLMQSSIFFDAYNLLFKSLNNEIHDRY
ncbi:MAG: hypothetical protein RMY35_035100 [Nostoc sp. DedSLP01]